MGNAAKDAQAPLGLSIAGGVCDLSKRSYFYTTMNGATTFSFINRPADCVFIELEVYLVSGIISWPANVLWPDGAIPQNLKTGRIHKFLFTRPQSTGADQWLGAYQPNY